MNDKRFDDLVKEINSYVEKNGELLDHYKCDGEDCFTYKVKTPNGKHFIMYLMKDKKLGYDTDPCVDFLLEGDTFDSTHIAYGPDRTYEKVLKEWEAIKSGTADERYYKSYSDTPSKSSEVKTYSFADPSLQEIVNFAEEVKKECIKINNKNIPGAVKYNSDSEVTKHIDEFPIGPLVYEFSHRWTPYQVAKMLMGLD